MPPEAEAGAFTLSGGLSTGQEHEAAAGTPSAEGSRGAPRSRVSAGILLYRERDGRVEVLIGHPGGPIFARKDAGHWTIPKGEVEPGEALETVAAREFAEETGSPLPGGPTLDLGSIRQKGGKVVHAWGRRGDLDVETAASNTFRMEWPPRSGRLAEFPELDRLAWLEPDEARARIKETQIPFIDRLLELLEAERSG
jgi:predicted NUDIX family NTP pyrophosphohydrolase